MSKWTRNYLKSRFETGDTPTVQDFTNLIDSCVNIQDDFYTYFSGFSGYSGYSGFSGYSGINRLPYDIQRYGFIDAVGETSISFDPNTYTFTLTDLGSGWEYYRTGKRNSVTGNRTVVLPGSPPADGLWFIYIDADDGTLTASMTGWTLNDTKVVVSTIILDKANTPKYQIAEERHSCLIDRREHRYLHFTRGCVYNSGLDISGYTMGSDVNTDKVFAIDTGIICDEDIFINIPTTVKPDGNTLAYLMYNKIDGVLWQWNLSDMPFSYVPSGAIQWNKKNISNEFELTEGTTGNWYNTYILHTNWINNPCIIISGRDEFATLYGAMSEVPFIFDWVGFNIAESIIGYQLTWQVNDSFTSKGKCQLASIQKFNLTFATAGYIPPEIKPYGNDQEIQFNDLGNFGSNSGFKYQKASKALTIGNPTILTDNPLAIQGDTEAFMQTNIQNTNPGTFDSGASADYIATADDGDNNSNYADLGICNSNYSNSVWDVCESHDTYVFGDGGNVDIGTLTPGKEVKIFAGQINHECHPNDIVATFGISGVNVIGDKNYSYDGVDIRQAEFDRFSDGVVSGGNITYGSIPYITYTVHSGIGWGWDGSVYRRVVWGDFIDRPAPSDGTTYIAIKYDGTLTLTTTEHTDKGYILLGKLIVQGGYIGAIFNSPEIVGNFEHLVYDFALKAVKVLINYGLEVSEGVTPLHLSVAGGEIFTKMNSVITNPQTTFVKVAGSIDQPYFADMVHNNNTIDTTVWNDTTQLAVNCIVPMTSGYWAKAIVASTIGMGGSINYVYPQSQWVTEDEAKSSPLPFDQLFSILLDTVNTSASLAAIVYQKGDTSIANRIYDIRPYLPRLFNKI